MSKKKRNRRPSPAPRATAPTGSMTTQDVAVDDAADASADDDAAQVDATSQADGATAVAATGDAIAVDTADAADAIDAAPSADADATRKDASSSNVAADAGASHAAAKPAKAHKPASKSPARAAHGGVAAFSGAGHESGDIRGVLIQIGGGRLLLPNATIAEVLSYAEPESEESTADWMLGRFRWRGWQLPLIAFSRLAGIGEDTPGLGSKVIVLKALGGDRRTPFFAIVTQGFPRLVTVSRTALSIEQTPDDLPPGVQAYVRLNDDEALLPDLQHIEDRLRELREAA